MAVLLFFYFLDSDRTRVALLKLARLQLIYIYTLWLGWTQIFILSPVTFWPRFQTQIIQFIIIKQLLTGGTPATATEETSCLVYSLRYRWLRWFDLGGLKQVIGPVLLFCPASCHGKTEKRWSCPLGNLAEHSCWILCFPIYKLLVKFVMGTS